MFLVLIQKMDGFCVQKFFLSTRIKIFDADLNQLILK